EERERFVRAVKRMELTVTGVRDYNEAVITKGGVTTSEVSPSTMESRLVSGLYFAGEVLDLDALTGGFNLQIAWSTGHLAGLSAASG
ncbi:MAG: NAD(P)/FAD-dependent oxidoreductase, partial [Lachnospiraceae bacterium]|nr:NAD(P)/FAD-dependent oxidoreductase [Lachnospiraceae bacterium]